jgi:hypothetical protein
VSLVQRRTSGPPSSIMRPSFVSVMTMNTINNKDEADSSFSFEEIGSPVRIRVSVDFELTFPVALICDIFRGNDVFEDSSSGIKVGDPWIVIKLRVSRQQGLCQDG